MLADLPQHTLVPDEKLRAVDDEVVRMRWMLFERYPDLIEQIAPQLSARDRVCNRYFWAEKFAALVAEKRAADAGLDQQVFKILEELV